MAILLPLLTSLVRYISTPQIHDLFATEISVLPLRPHGVQHIIEFIASSLVPASALRGDEQNLQDQVQEIPMSLEALQQASRLLSSVPPSLGPSVYFGNIVPQLLELLDGSCGPIMSTAASYIIGTGILGKRSTGAPGTIGWELFAVPLIDTLNPNPSSRKDHTLGTQTSDRVSLGKVVVSNAELDLAVKRLSKIVLSHPNPGLTKRLLQSLLLPLWGVASFNEEKFEGSSIASSAWKLLETYIRLYANSEQISEFAKNVMFDGTRYWAYRINEKGLLEIQRRAEPQLGQLGFLEKMTPIDRRVSLFVKLLSICNMPSNLLCAIILDAVKNWLSSQDLGPLKPMGGLQDSQDVLLPLVNLKLAMELISNFQNEIASQPQEIVRIVDWLLADAAKPLNRVGKRGNRPLANPTLARLGQISQSAAADDYGSGSDEVSNESTTIVALAFSLLDTAMQTASFQLGSEGRQHMESISVSIGTLRRQSLDLPSSLTVAAASVQSRIEEFLHGKGQPTPSAILEKTALSKRAPKNSASIESDHEAYAEALQNISSPQPPVRVEGLSSLSALIRASSPVVDVPAASVMLLAILSEDAAAGGKSRFARSTNQSEPDEADDYLILGTLRTLSQLAGYEPRIVMPLLLETYLDRSSIHSLDARLRVAEGLGFIINAFTPTNPGDKVPATREQTVVQIAEATITIASRRGRSKTPTTSSTHESPPAPELLRPPVDVDSGDPLSTEDETIRRIVESWGLSPHNEEDLRLRTSALSLLSQIVSNSSLSVLCANSLLDSVVEIACAVLRLESGPENAITRRAAGLVLVQFVKAVERLFDEDGEAALLRVGVDVDSSLGRIGAIMRDLLSQDEDELVRGHAAAVLEEIETWRIKRMVGISETGGPEAAGMTSELDLKSLRGLNVGVDRKDENKGERQRLIEEVED